MLINSSTADMLTTVIPLPERYIINKFSLKLPARYALQVHQRIRVWRFSISSGHCRLREVCSTTASHVDDLTEGAAKMTLALWRRTFQGFTPRPASICEVFALQEILSQFMGCFPISSWDAIQSISKVGCLPVHDDPPHQSYHVQGVAVGSRYY